MLSSRARTILLRLIPIQLGARYQPGASPAAAGLVNMAAMATAQTIIPVDARANLQSYYLVPTTLQS